MGAVNNSPQVVQPSTAEVANPIPQGPGAEAPTNGFAVLSYNRVGTMGAEMFTGSSATPGTDLLYGPNHVGSVRQLISDLKKEMKQRGSSGRWSADDELRIAFNGAGFDAGMRLGQPAIEALEKQANAWAAQHRADTDQIKRIQAATRPLTHPPRPPTTSPLSVPFR